MKGKLFISILMVLVIFTAVGQIGADAVENKAGKNISLEQAYELAFASSSVVEMAVYDVQKAEAKLQWANTVADSINSDKVDSYEKGKAKTLGPAQAKSELVVAEEKLKQTQAQFKIDVIEAYYGLLNARKALESAKANYIRADEVLKVVEAKYKAGSVAKNEVLAAEVQAGLAKATLLNAENDEKTALMQNNQMLGLALTSGLNLTSQLAYVPSAEINLEEEIAKAINKRVDILQARETINVKRVENQLTKSYFGPGVYTYEDSRYSLLQAESTLREKLKLAELSITTSYFKILSLNEQYHVAETSLKQAKEALLLTQKRFEVGLAASTELTSASAALCQTESKLADVLGQYIVAKAQFDFNLGNY